MVEVGTKVIAIELPCSHAMMRPDVPMAISPRTFVAHPYPESTPRSWTVQPAASPEDPDALGVVADVELGAAIAHTLGVDEVTVLRTDEDTRPHCMTCPIERDA